MTTKQEDRPVPVVKRKERDEGVQVGSFEVLKRDALAWVSGWFNPTTGVGDPTRDKMASTLWAGGAPMEPELLESLFAFSDLSYAIVMALPEWGLRHGWDLTLEAPGGDEQPAVGAQKIESAVRAATDELGVHPAQLTAAAWGQLFGGGLILVGAIDGRTTDQPLDLDKLQRIEWLRVVDRRDAWITHVGGDEGAERFGKPTRYEILEAATYGKGPQVWHHSRVIAYPGAMTPARLKRQNKWWDYSVLDRVISQLKLHDGLWSNVGQMLSDGSQGVWRIRGLFNAVASGRRDELENRFAIADKTRSMFRSLLLDADGESFEYVHRQYGGIDGLLAQSAIRTAAAAQMPVTLLYGQSPAGLNATGESDIRLWYDRVEQYQEDVLRARLERIVELIFRSKEGPTQGVEPPGWRITFRHVRKETPMEESEKRARQAQIDAAYVTNGVLAPEEIAVSRFTSEGYSYETQIDLKARSEALAERRKRERDAAKATGPRNVQALALNGAQVTAAAGIVAQVARGEIPRESGVALLVLAFPQALDQQGAEVLVGGAGREFKATAPKALPPPAAADDEDEEPAPPEGADEQ